MNRPLHGPLNATPVDHALFDEHKGAPRRLTVRQAPGMLRWSATYPGAPGDDYPTFRDGHWENVLADAVRRSNRDRSWVEVPT